jgi:hypothetical protein
MYRLLCALVITTFGSATMADPPTPASHPEKDWLALGHGVYLLQAEDAEPRDEHGNIKVPVYSSHRINVGEHFTLDQSPMMGIPNDLSYDGGTFGELRMQWVKIDCANRTYAVLDTRRILSDDIWRAVDTLPGLAPVFQHFCPPS